MRLTVISTLIFAVCTLLVCFLSLQFIKSTALEVEQLRLQTVADVRADRPESALEDIRALEKYWENRSRTLELLIPHDDLHEIASYISDARICLEVEDIDDFLRSSEQLKAAVGHISSIQAISIGNIY